MSINRYNTLISQLEKFQKLEDNESAHIIQDKIYKKFIKDINNNRLTSLEEIQNISKLLCNKVCIHDKDRWYA